MYKITFVDKRVERKVRKYIEIRKDIPVKLDRLIVNPRKECGAHPLHGKLRGRWACWLGSNIRLIYIIDDKNEMVIAVGIGTHNLY
jgi:addiction module RelE/StbE family toxin|tara:strand:+ start:318 stop:575 length:258 start_codon:yes stop_codon:yes gene_type:complete